MASSKEGISSSWGWRHLLSIVSMPWERQTLILRACSFERVCLWIYFSRQRSFWMEHIAWGYEPSSDGRNNISGPFGVREKGDDIPRVGWQLALWTICLRELWPPLDRKRRATMQGGSWAILYHRLAWTTWILLPFRRSRRWTCSSMQS